MRRRRRRKQAGGCWRWRRGGCSATDTPAGCAETPPGATSDAARSQHQLGVFGDLRKPRAVRDNEILKVHCLRHILIRLNVRDPYLRVTHARLTVRLKWFSD